MNQPWHMPRRRFLRGLGTIVALPMLESLCPPVRALAAGTSGPAATAIPKRVAWIYVPNGKNMADWTPSVVGEGYDLPMILEPLKAHQQDFNVITGLAHEQANGLGDGGGDHARASAAYLTGCHPRKTAGADIKAGISVDQIAANKIGDQTRLASLELSCDGGQRAGSCDSGYSCAYQFNLAWKSETQPINPEVDPRQVFERMFGGGATSETIEARAKRELYSKSVLDFVLEDTRSLNARLGAGDRRKLDEYLSAIRDLEHRIAQSEKFQIKTPPPGQVAPNPKQDINYEQHIRLMYDMMVLAFQTDSTRIASFIVAHDGSNRPYPFIGIPDGHHDLSHHRNEEAKKVKLAQINRWHTTQFAYFLDRLKSVPEGDGTLLDHCLIHYGSGISDGNQHLHENLPVLLAGGGGGAITTGRHVNVGDKVPMTNLYRSMLEVMDVPTEKIGDSTGTLDRIFHPLV